MSLLSEQIRQAREELRSLRRRLRSESTSEPERHQGVPYDPEFDSWKAKSRRGRYLKIIRDVTVSEGSPVAKRRSS